MFSRLSSKNRASRRQAGFTLIEILMAALIFALGIAAAARVFVVGKYFLKQSENKSRAMHNAAMIMERYMARSFKGLEDMVTSPANFSPMGSQPWPDTCSASGLYASTCQCHGVDPVYPNNFSWDVYIQKQTVTGNKNNIPYFHIEVVSNYSQEDIRQNIYNAAVRLANIVPYAYYHIESVRHIYDQFTDPPPLVRTGWVGGVSGVEVWDQIALLPLNNLVTKDFYITYNLQVIGKFIPQLGNSVMSRCLYSTDYGATWASAGIITETPIITQPFISNVAAVKGIGPNLIRADDDVHKNQIKVEWRAGNRSIRNDINNPGAWIPGTATDPTDLDHPKVELYSYELIVVESEPRQ